MTAPSPNKSETCFPPDAGVDWSLFRTYLSILEAGRSAKARVRSPSSGKRALKGQVPGKVARRNIDNLRYAADTTLMAETEELKSLLMKVKQESEKVA